ncbi:MAG: pyridoxamine 5'-phosphate oxidase family protein [Eubacteriales bacterium]|nr:pyridoxamine 5'-phosphate oxidase family protein [Eubacteriales bacterium]MDY3332522.1 pyridoxamine 5'-phosphate oxidase family protein [Gallibacter sp.]
MEKRFKKMRRSEREISRDEIIEILEKGEYGVLATFGENGFPYGVPMSYVYVDGSIYFHVATGVGQKYENIKYCDKVSFTVVTHTKVLPERFSTEYESAIVFGNIVFEEDKLKALEKIANKYSPDFEVQGRKYALASVNKVDIYRLDIVHMTGKAMRK